MLFLIINCCIAAKAATDNWKVPPQLVVHLRFSSWFVLLSKFLKMFLAYNQLCTSNQNIYHILR